MQVYFCTTEEDVKTKTVKFYDNFHKKTVKWQSRVDGVAQKIAK